MNHQLAEASPWQHLGRHFREGGSSADGGDALVVLGVIVGVLLAAWLLSRLFAAGERRPYRSSLWLFRELCRAHRLSWRESWLLWRLAQAHDLAEPASLFLKPECFAEENTPAALDERRGQIDRLRERLFGEP